MPWLNITLADGVIAHVAEVNILDTYAGQLAGTMTVGTRHQVIAYANSIDEIKSGKKTGCFFLTPEFVAEANLRGISDREAERIRRHTYLGKCLKEQHIVATLHVSDKDYCHIIEMHWFQTGVELNEKPISTLSQQAVGWLSFEELYPYFEHVDWLDF